MRARGVGLRITVISKTFEIMEKFYSLKILLKLAGGGDAFPTYPHLEQPLLTMANHMNHNRYDF